MTTKRVRLKGTTDKLINLPDETVAVIAKKAIDKKTDFKNYVQALLVAHGKKIEK